MTSHSLQNLDKYELRKYAIRIANSQIQLGRPENLFWCDANANQGHPARQNSLCQTTDKKMDDSTISAQASVHAEVKLVVQLCQKHG
jgi:hypothetical protein